MHYTDQADSRRTSRDQKITTEIEAIVECFQGRICDPDELRAA